MCVSIHIFSYISLCAPRKPLAFSFSVVPLAWSALGKWKKWSMWAMLIWETQREVFI